MKNTKEQGKPQQPIASEHKSRLPLMVALVIAFVTLLVYVPSTHNSFVNWDDNAYVFENDHLAAPFSDAISYFFQLHYVLGSYTPLTMTVITAIVHTAGIDATVFHTVSVLLHIINVLLVFGLVFGLAGKRLWVAGIVALLFGIHPVHAESVMWVAELKDVLYSAFFLGSLIVYITYLGGMRFKWLALCFGLFVLSLLSKPAAVTMPVALLLLDYYRGRKIDGRALLEKLPFLVLSVVFGIITLKGQTTYVIVNDQHSIAERFFYACYSIVVYLQKLLVPTGLSIFYPYPELAAWHYATPVVAVALLYAAFKYARSQRWVTFGILFFFVNMVLTLPFLSTGMSVLAEHYMYLPYMGLFLIIAIAADKYVLAQGARFERSKNAVLGGLAVFAVCCAGLTYGRAEAWQNDTTMADDLVSKYPNDCVALNNKGFILYSQQHAQQSIPYFEKAISGKADFPFAVVNLSNAYIATGNLDKALNVVDTGLVHMPAGYDLMTQRGYVMILQKRYAEAQPVYEKAIAIKPIKRNAWLGLAECYFQLHDLAGEIKVLDRGLQHLPDDYMLLNYKGYALMQTGKPADAVPLFEAALQQKPGFKPAEENLEQCRRMLAAPVR